MLRINSYTSPQSAALLSPPRRLASLPATDRSETDRRHIPSFLLSGDPSSSAGDAGLSPPNLSNLDGASGDNTTSAS